MRGRSKKKVIPIEVSTTKDPTTQTTQSSAKRTTASRPKPHAEEATAVATPTEDSTLEPASTPLGISFYSRWVPEKSDHGKLYTNLSYQFTDAFRAGVDYRPITNDVSVLANWRILEEDEGWKPALILGTSNDDFGDESSQAFFGTFSKYLHSFGDAHFSGYAGATYILDLNELRPVGGAVLSYENWTTTLMYSGTDTHWVLSRRFGNQTFSLFFFALDLPGAAYGIHW